MTTLDFELEIGLCAAGSYPVVARASSGEVSTTLQMSLTPDEFDDQLAVIRHSVLTGDEQPVRKFGQRLFDALIADDVWALYVASRQRARENDEVLRLVLWVRPPELARLPWEFLFNPDRQDYLGLTVPVVRYLEVLGPRQPLRVEAPLRVLGMVARPGDQHALDAEQEQQRLQKALADLQREGLVELEWVTGQTYRDLDNALQDGPWHVFHFIGHGGYDRRTDEGTLALADETGRTQLVPADDISRVLAEHPPLRLVVLNACDTGRGSAVDAFTSTAAALIRREVPAVVAMQFEISDSAAIWFAETFYHYVAKHQPVDDSVMRARRELRLKGRQELRVAEDSLEWGTPVLYLRALDGHIFDATIPRSPPRPDPFPDPVSTPEMAAIPPTSAHHERPAPPLAQRRVFRDANSVQVLPHREAVNAVAFSPGGRWLATASSDGTAQVWDITSGQQLATVTHSGYVLGVMFSPDWIRLATASSDRTARIWDTGGQHFATFTHKGDVLGVAFSQDGRLATASGDGTARVWHASSGQELATVTHNGSRVLGVAFSPDGFRLATASDDKTARIWDSASGRELAAFNHNCGVREVTFSPNGCRLATASDDKTARIWDAVSGRELARFRHKGFMRGVVFSPDGRWLATASEDGTARIWDATRGQQLATVTHRNSVWGVAFSPDGRQLATASEDKTTRVLTLSDDE